MQMDERTDKDTDMTKLIVAFRNIATAHKKIQILKSLWRINKQFENPTSLLKLLR